MPEVPAVVAQTGPVGRPSLYSREVCDRIIDGLTEGMSLIKICEQEGFPSRRTVMRWWTEKPAFAAECAQARVLQADLMDDMIIDLMTSVNEENVNSSRVKLSALQWRASKLAPKKYGDKVQQEITGANGGPVQLLAAQATPKEAAEAYAASLTDGTK